MQVTLRIEYKLSGDSKREEKFTIKDDLSDFFEFKQIMEKWGADASESNRELEEDMTFDGLDLAIECVSATKEERKAFNKLIELLHLHGIKYFEIY